jgi:hypothetical protein
MIFNRFFIAHPGQYENMKRKKFIIISAVAVAAVAVPVTIKFRHHRKTRSKPLEEPKILGNFCNAKDIREIGTEYMKRVPHESQKQQLIELLMKNDEGKRLNSTDITEISDWLDVKTDKEFRTDKTIEVAGWVISVTEARQCALFSLS